MQLVQLERPLNLQQLWQQQLWQQQPFLLQFWLLPLQDEGLIELEFDEKRGNYQIRTKKVVKKR